jgi:hypothetical protein
VHSGEDVAESAIGVLLAFADMKTPGICKEFGTDIFLMVRIRLLDASMCWHPTQLFHRWRREMSATRWLCMASTLSISLLDPFRKDAPKDPDAAIRSD